MKNAVKVLVHYDAGIDPCIVVDALLEEWRRSNRPALSALINRKIIEISRKAIRERLTFHPDIESVSITFRSLGKKHRDRIELFFTNPKWKYQRSSSSVAMYLSANAVAKCEPGYDEESLVSMLEALVKCGSVRNGLVDSTEVLYGDTMDALERRHRLGKNGSAWPTLLYWITFVPKLAGTKIRRFVTRSSDALRIARDLGKRGLIVAICDRKPSNTSDQIKQIRKVNSELGLL